MKTQTTLRTLLLVLLLGSFGLTQAQVSGTPYYWENAVTLPYNLMPSQPKPIVSVYDTDYKPFVFPTVAANRDTGTTGNAPADGTAESVAVDFQGTLTTTGIPLDIDFTTGTGSANLPARTYTVNVPASYTEDGISRDVTLSWPAQTLTGASGTFTATIASVGGTLNLKKLDVNAGIGDDILGVLVATFTIHIDEIGSTGEVELRSMSAIPDREYGDGTHDFLYAAIRGDDGNIWLNNNLGAHYTNIHHASFDPCQQATAYNDFRAYGSMYQWGRYSDGHEIINWTSATGSDGAEQARETTVKPANITPGHDDFIIDTNLTARSWTQDVNTLINHPNVWNGDTGANNPCSGSFRIPTLADFQNFNWNNRVAAWNSALKMSIAGRRLERDGRIFDASDTSAYGARDKRLRNISGTIQAQGGVLVLRATSSGYGHFGVVHGMSVRCIKD